MDIKLELCEIFDNISDRSGLYREAQFGCGVVGHIAGPHKPFVSKFVWPRLLESCVPAHIPIILLANLAAANLAANLSTAVFGVANLLFPTSQLQCGLAGQTWVSRAACTSV